jgi:hypothetical protein
MRAIKSLENFTAENKEAAMPQMLLAGMYRDNNQEEKARPLLLRLFEDIRRGQQQSYYPCLLQCRVKSKKAKKISDPDKENFALAFLINYKNQIPKIPMSILSAATSI